ncbi:50S ribosomal protein L29 [Candidatus Nitrosotenuis chungbukensis]|uniref:50S ribosomal protein L29 n=1 Tax=Candidatus Nitrosotenuis TaxID=1825023 RepID=UPI0005B2A297|nr:MULTISPECIES: 50S ribosomal protein L29 [Nitrosotenuis]QLH08864.1 50S ribosomal protein L29 [Candidatus Nitrosotenuis sp. DW1]WKT57466.1 50S ribosomal protein L29 [Candidatus Nitrosotenuis chungbukensis]
MARLKMKSIRELNAQDLKEKLAQSRVELSKIRTEAAKGTLRKESGKIRAYRKEIARMLTKINEAKTQ